MREYRIFAGSVDGRKRRVIEELVVAQTADDAKNRFYAKYGDRNLAISKVVPVTAGPGEQLPVGRF
jgi:hypothetical protein